MKRWILLFFIAYVQLFAGYGDQKFLQEWIDTEIPIHLESTQDIDLSKLQTKAFNVVRLFWENPTEFEILNKDELSIGAMITMNLQRRALLKARKFLLELQNHKAYSKQSSLYLAIALSYYLENKFYAFNEIISSMQNWQEYGSEIPKNLVKMTSYEDSIKLISFLKHISSQKDIELLELIKSALQEHKIDLIGVPNHYYQAGYDWANFGVDTKEFMISNQAWDELLSTQWIIPFKQQYFVVAPKEIQSK